MSMHEVEAFTEYCVNKIAKTDLLTIRRKRSLIKKSYEFQSYGDCGFTQLRTIDEMVECKYSFLFKKDEMYDYNEEKEFYDKLNDYLYTDGSVYAYWSEEFPKKNGMVCVDSGTEAWKEMVSRGYIQGEGAEELEEISFIEALKEFSKILNCESTHEFIMFSVDFIAHSNIPEERKQQLILSMLTLEVIVDKKYGMNSNSKAWKLMVEKGFIAAEMPEISKEIDAKKFSITQQQLNEISNDEYKMKASEFVKDLNFIIKGLYNFIILTSIDEELEDEDYLIIFGVNKEQLEKIMGL